MADPTPSPEEARAALDQAERHADRLRLEDQRLRLVLVVIAVVYVALGFLLALPRVQQPAINPGITLVGLIGGGSVACVILLRGLRAASRRGMVRYFQAITAFVIWNVAVMAVSTATGWWGTGVPGLHFTASMVVAAVPLVVAAVLMGSRRR
jgi:hypothetical protein